MSGGLDSATVVAYAREQGFENYGLSFDYGQRNRSELAASKRVAAQLGVSKHIIFPLALDCMGGSALTDQAIDVPDYCGDGHIPVTYVPARNTIFLSIALGFAEVFDAHDIFIGANAVDYSGYPDCRPDYLAAFQTMANLATKAGVQGNGVQIHAPLVDLPKTDIVKMGIELEVDYAQTVTCYQADEKGRACGHCDSCVIRRDAFHLANIEDPTAYQEKKNGRRKKEETPTKSEKKSARS